MPGQISNASSAVGNVSLLNGHTQLAGKTILYNFNNATGGGATVKTVTGGKTYYLIAAGLHYYSTETNKQAQLYIDADTNKIMAFQTHITATYYTADSNQQTITFPHPIPIAAGINIVVHSNGGATMAQAWVIGWEE